MNIHCTVIDIKKLKKQLTALIGADKAERRDIMIEENFTISIYKGVIQIFIMWEKIMFSVN